VFDKTNQANINSVFISNSLPFDNPKRLRRRKLTSNVSTFNLYLYKDLKKNCFSRMNVPIILCNQGDEINDSWNIIPQKSKLVFIDI
jgi:hypothetical protein